MKSVSLLFSTAFLLSISQSLSAPRIEFDTKIFQCGTFVEGKVDRIHASFVVKNSGDSVLRLESVRPGCGCTVVKYDTLIKPGKSAKIESAVNIKGYRSGPISKSITVTSNAENEPTVRLSIKATIQAPIELSESFLNFDSTRAGTPKIIILSTKKQDLRISALGFRHSETDGGTPEWQKDLSLTVKFNFTPLDSVRSDGYKNYKLEIFCPESGKPGLGTITIRTNHPDKKEIVVSSNIRK